MVKGANAGSFHEKKVHLLESKDPDNVVAIGTLACLENLPVKVLLGAIVTVGEAEESDLSKGDWNVLELAGGCLKVPCNVTGVCVGG